MKTEKEVKDYLQEQPWFTAFIKNFISHRSGKELMHYILGEYGGSTLCCAFTWSNTQEGNKFWATEEEKFRNWYNENTFEELKIGTKFTIGENKEDIYTKIDEQHAKYERRVCIDNATVVNIV